MSWSYCKTPFPLTDVIINVWMEEIPLNVYLLNGLIKCYEPFNGLKMIKQLIKTFILSVRVVLC